MTLPKLPSGSTANTHAKAATGILLVKGTALVLGAAFIWAAFKCTEGLVANMLYAWLAFLAAFMGINTFQYKTDRDTDYEALKIKAGAPATTVQNVNVASGGAAQVTQPDKGGE